MALVDVAAEDDDDDDEAVVVPEKAPPNQPPPVLAPKGVVAAVSPDVNLCPVPENCGKKEENVQYP